MLTNKLQDSLNEKWQNCWPVSDLRPLALLDLISFLFFVKKVDDLALIHQKINAAESDNFTYSKETEQFTWAALQNLNDHDIHRLFVKAHGIIDLINTYAQAKGLFSDYFKAPLLIEPTPKLLSNAIDIINIIETCDRVTREEIAEYLFIKSNLSKENNQFVPAHVTYLMTSLAEPLPGKIIFDPAAGNGDLLISAFKFINFGQTNNIKISGQESDVVHLRIAAMNMILHGINNPDIFVTQDDNKVNEKPSIIISALLSQNDGLADWQNTNFSSIEREANLLNNITENLAAKGRAVVLVSQYFLKNEDQAVIKIRKKLVEQFNLEGVITLATKTGSLYSGAAILIFNHINIKTENIWFYKWKADKKNRRNSFLSDENKDHDVEEAENILQLWKTRKDSPAPPSANTFFISADFLRSNNYNLSFNDYKIAHQKESLQDEPINSVDVTSEEIIAAKKETLHEFFESGVPLPKEKDRRKVAPALVTVLILICAVAFYWIYSKNNPKSFTANINPSDATVSSTSDSNGAAIEINNKTISSADTLELIGKSAREINKEPDINSTKYTVKSKAWFHSKPDSNKVKPFYLSPRNEVVLTPQDDENGFIYVVYINSKGEATHGWLDKEDLQAVN